VYTSEKINSLKCDALWQFSDDRTQISIHPELHHYISSRCKYTTLEDILTQLKAISERLLTGATSDFPPLHTIFKVEKTRDSVTGKVSDMKFTYPNNIKDVYSSIPDALIGFMDYLKARSIPGGNCLVFQQELTSTQESFFTGFFSELTKANKITKVRSGKAPEAIDSYSIGRETAKSLILSVVYNNIPRGLTQQSVFAAYRVAKRTIPTYLPTSDSVNFRAFGITIAKAAKYYIELNIDEFKKRVNPSVIDPSSLQSKTLRHFTVTEIKKKGKQKVTVDHVKTKAPIPAYTLQGLFLDEIERLKLISKTVSKEKLEIANKITVTYKLINQNIAKATQDNDIDPWKLVHTYITECKEGLAVISNSNNYLYNLKEKVSSAIRTRNK
jgi:hypothetical protein